MAHYVKREWRVFMEDTLEREVNVRYERDNSINYAVKMHRRNGTVKMTMK